MTYALIIILNMSPITLANGMDYAACMREAAVFNAHVLVDGASGAQCRKVG